MKRSLAIMIVMVVGLNGCTAMNSLRATHSVIQTKPKLSPAEAYAKGKEAEHRYQYAKAVRFYLTAAQRGDTNAELRLGRLYRDGHKGVDRDLSASASWFLKAAEQGSTLAQYELGEIYYKGKGVKKDYGRALRWYKKAASHGETASEYHLAQMYYNGIGVKRNAQLAFKWYKAAASAGHSQAQLTVGRMYIKGEGVGRNIEEAIKWLSSVANDPRWARLSADDSPGNEARLELASIYESGEGVARDSIKAFGLIKDASDHGSIEAKIELARHYMDGQGVVKDFPAAIQLLSEVPEGAKYNSQPVMAAAVRNALKEGEKAYRKKRYRDALRNLEAAANYGNARAQDRLGNMYFGGVGVPKDYGRAMEWWGKAAQQDDLKAIASLGISYWIGVGNVSRNPDDAIKYLLYAAKKGNRHARSSLETLVFPKWHYVANLRDGVALVRRDRIRKHRGLVLFLVMSLSAPDSIQDGYHFTSYSKLVYQANCSNKTVGLRRIFEYAAGGRLTNSTRHPSVDMVSVVSGSAEAGYLKYVCSIVRY